MADKMPIKVFVEELYNAYKRKDGYIMCATGQNPRIWAENSWWFTQYSGAQRTKALYWRKHAERVWDCNGMAEGLYKDYTKIDINTKARFNYANWCNPKGSGMIPANKRVPGAAVFWSNDSAANIHHVAYLFKPVKDGHPEGDWYIIEARGVNYGVVMTKLYSRKPNYWGWMTKYFDYSNAVVETPTITLGERELKKGNYGEDVRQMQQLLLDRGYKLPKYGADGDFGTETEDALKVFQLDNGLLVNGIYDNKTHSVLTQKIDPPITDLERHATTNTEVEVKVVWDFLLNKIRNEYGVAGLMGNLKAESGLMPMNLQNTYETKLRFTDETYTKAVDTGSYNNFVDDAAGYGLAQWTSAGRKRKLLAYAKEKNSSIGNLYTQLEFLVDELAGSYKTVYSVLKEARSVREASDAVLLKFEIPKDRSESVQIKRAGYGEEYYKLYAKAETEDVGPVLKKGSKGKDVKDLQNILLSLGYKLPKYGADGDFGAETEDAIKAYQKDHGLQQTGQFALKELEALKQIVVAITVTGLVVNIRAGAGMNFKILGAVKKGATLEYMNEKSNNGSGWYKVKYKNKTGWISARYSEIK